MKFKNVYSLILLLAIFAQQNSSVGESRSIRNVLTKIHQEEERLVNGSSKDLLPILALKNFNIPKLCDWKSPNLGRNSTYGRYNPKYCLTPGIMPIYHFLVDFLRFQQIDQMTIIIDIDGQNFDGTRLLVKCNCLTLNFFKDLEQQSNTSPSTWLKHKSYGVKICVRFKSFNFQK